MSVNIEAETPFLSREDVETLDLFLPMKDWVKIAFEYEEATAKFTQIILENYSYATAYKSNAKTVKSCILYSLPEDKIAIIELTNGFIRAKRNKQQEELWKQRMEINRLVTKLYNNLGHLLRLNIIK
jgi:hypothetical protein